MNSRLRFLLLIVAVPALFLACNRQPAELKPIQQQRSGNYTVTVLNDSGTLKQKSDRLTLEFRNASDNELAIVSDVKIEASMVMAGMAPMFGTMSPVTQDAPGRYSFTAEFGMAGQWNFTITFSPNGRAQFALRAQ